MIARLQWTPELSEEIAAAESVVFIDASVQVSPGEIRVAPVASAQDAGEVATHYNDAAHLLQLCSYLYGVAPRSSLLLTIGVGSTELGEGFSDAVEAALPEAHRVLEELVIDTRI